MEIAFVVLAALVLLAGFVGCLVPVLPGPALSYAGLLLLLPTRYAPSVLALVACGMLVAGVMVLDYIVPALGAKKFQCSKWGVFGCMLGTIAGLFFAPFGLLIGPFLGAFLAELLTGRTFKASFKGGMGAFVGFLAGLFLKFTACSIVAIAAAWSVFAAK